MPFRRRIVTLAGLFTFLPEAWLAVLFWLVRAFFVQMDAPTSQSYTIALVAPEERSTMAAPTSVSRSTGITAGPDAATSPKQGGGMSGLHVAELSHCCRSRNPAVISWVSATSGEFSRQSHPPNRS